MQDDILAELTDLLETEKSLLLAGRIEAVSDLEEPKVELIDRLTQMDRPSAEALQALQQKVARNQALLEASRKGFRAASDRLAEIRKAMLRLDTYTRTGEMQNLGRATPSIERRA